MLFSRFSWLLRFLLPTVFPPPPPPQWFWSCPCFFWFVVPVFWFPAVFPQPPSGFGLVRFFVCPRFFGFQPFSIWSQTGDLPLFSSSFPRESKGRLGGRLNKEAFYGLFTGCLRPLTKGVSYSGRGSSGFFPGFTLRVCVLHHGITPLGHDSDWLKITRVYPDMCRNGVNTQWVYSQGVIQTPLDLPPPPLPRFPSMSPAFLYPEPSNYAIKLGMG